MELQTFATFDEYAAALGHSQLRLIALARERDAWTMGAIELDGIRVRTARDGGPCLFDVAIEADGVGLLVGVDAAGKISGNGVMMGPHSVMVIPGWTEIRSTSFDAVSWLSVFVPAARLGDGARTGMGRPLRRIPSGIIEPATREGFSLRETLARVVTAALLGAFEANKMGRREAAGQLLAGARALVGGAVETSLPDGQRGRPRRSRSAIMKAAYALLDQRAVDLITLGDLSNATGISQRTLRSVFLDQVGVSPKRFLRLRILNAARRELRQADPLATQVSDVLARLGIWEWGRFSRDYRALFGELPSETPAAASGRRDRVAYGNEAAARALVGADAARRTPALDRSRVRLPLAHAEVRSDRHAFAGTNPDPIESHVVSAPAPSSPTVFIVDDDESIRQAMTWLLEAVGLATESFATPDAFLARSSPDLSGCLLVDLRMPGLSGLELVRQAAARGCDVPFILMSAHVDVAQAVRAMKAGAIEVLVKPFDDQVLIDTVHQALDVDRARVSDRGQRQALQARVDRLTAREREVLTLVTQGLLNKQIAARLGTAEKTVKVHRGRVMHKMGAGSLAELIQLAGRLGVGPSS